MENKQIINFIYEKFSKYSNSSEKVDKDCQEYTRKNYQQKAVEILNCMICLSKVNNAHMCPHCSKLSCESCIKDWLENKKSECPNCRKNLKIYELVNCARFAKQIDETIVQLTKRDQEEDLCKKHKTKMQYYCKTCIQPICSDCAMIGNEHKNHQFDKLSNIINKQQQKLKVHIQSLSNKRRIFMSNLNDIEGKIKHIRQLKTQKLIELQKLLNYLIQQRIEKKYLSESTKLKSEQNRLYYQEQSLKSILDTVSSKLTTYSKSKLTKEEKNLIELIRSYRIAEIQQFKLDHQYCIHSEISPTYEKTTFIVPAYSQLRKKKQVYYTEIFKSRGLEWRLKMYPNGNQSSQDNYISIFVELFRGILEIGKYKYKVEIINQKNRTLKISREFQSDFQFGECWGYNTYSKISNLYEQGYVHPQEDFIEVVLYIKSPTFYHQILDQNKIIENKKKIIEQNRIKIKELKQKLKKPGDNVDNQKSNEQKINKSLIQLDEICEISLNQQHFESSPLIQDREIFGKIIKFQPQSLKKKIERFNIRSTVVLKSIEKEK